MNTDTSLMVTFLNRLVQVLESENKHFRKDLVLLLDGASYHKSPETKLTMRQLGLNYVISAPYSYDAAPIELLFAYWKKSHINPQDEKTGKR